MGYNVSFKFYKDIKKKVNRFQTICGKIGRNLGRKTTEETHEIL